MSGLAWRFLTVSPKELNIAKVLRCGQAFRWKNINNVWSCSLGHKVLFLEQKGDQLWYASLPEEDLGDLVHDYFNLKVKIADLYENWCKVDTVFRRNAMGFEGVRMLRQEPWENLISFICSSNNNIKRISQMCDNLCVHFGDLLTEYKGVCYYSFPTPERLAQADVEEKLREFKFGYRAKYIHNTAKMVVESGIDLHKLRSKPYEQVHEELLKFSGVGPKVADCVCLMSMDKHDAIPVDTHVYQIAKRDYKLKSRGEAVTKQTYELVRKFFVELWGEYAGWAQSVLFAADLRDLVNGLNVVEIEKEVKIEIDASKRVREVNIKQEVKIKEEFKVKKESFEWELKPEEIEYSNTGRPKRRKTLKIRV